MVTSSTDIPSDYKSNAVDTVKPVLSTTSSVVLSASSPRTTGDESDTPKIRSLPKLFDTEDKDGKKCSCETECEDGASNIHCAIHGVNPEFRARSKDVPDDMRDVVDIGAETIGAIKEYHGHKKFDINKHVKRKDSIEIEEEVMRTTINEVLHMAIVDPDRRRKMKELAANWPSYTSRPRAKKKDVKNGRKEAAVPVVNNTYEASNETSTASKQLTTSAKNTSAYEPDSPQILRKQGVRKKKAKVTNLWDQCLKDGEAKCLCRVPRPKPPKVPSHRLRARSMKAPPDSVSMPLQPPPLGYRWSYRRFAPNNEKHKMVDHRHYLTPPFHWVLVPTELSIKKKKSYDWLKDAKYGYRNQMDPNDFSLVNHNHFPPYCYPIVEPLRYPYQSFNSPPFAKRAPLEFIHGRFTDKIECKESFLIDQLGQREAKFTNKDLMRAIPSHSQKNTKRVGVDTEDDAWAGYKPKYIKSPITHIWKFNKQLLSQQVSESSRLKVSETSRQKFDKTLKEDEVKPIISVQTVLKGQSIW